MAASSSAIDTFFRNALHPFGVGQTTDVERKDARPGVRTLPGPSPSGPATAATPASRGRRRRWPVATDRRHPVAGATRHCIRRLLGPGTGRQSANDANSTTGARERTVQNDGSASNCSTKAQARRKSRRSRSLPLTRTRPVTAPVFFRPASTSSSVVLPAPLAPIYVRDGARSQQVAPATTPIGATCQCNQHARLGEQRHVLQQGAVADRIA